MNTANAAFSKSVSCTSMGLNSTRQPMDDPAGGGLKRRVCQFVDWMFYSIIAGHQKIFVWAEGAVPYLKMVVAGGIVLMNSLREYYKWVPNK